MMWLANCSRIISLGSIGCSARESSSLVNCPDICQDARWLSKIGRDLGRKVGAHIDVELGELFLDKTAPVVGEFFAGNRQVDVEQNRPTVGEEDEPFGGENVVGCGRAGHDQSDQQQKSSTKP